MIVMFMNTKLTSKYVQRLGRVDGTRMAHRSGIQKMAIESRDQRGCACVS